MEALENKLASKKRSFQTEMDSTILEMDREEENMAKENQMRVTPVTSVHALL